jgi:diguanylate cyclase (GGDEF)-like protein
MIATAMRQLNSGFLPLAAWRAPLTVRVYILLGSVCLLVISLAVMSVQLAHEAAQVAKPQLGDLALVSPTASALASLHERATYTSQLVIGLTALTLFLVGPLGMSLVGSVRRRLSTISRTVFRLSRNDLSAPEALDPVPDEIGAMARAVAAVSDNERALIESRRQLEQLNLYLDVALNNMRRGLSMFDADEHLVLCNDVYRRMYDLPDHLTRRGATLKELIQHRLHVSAEDDPAVHERLASYRAFIANKLPRNHLITNPDGRVIDVSLQPLASGGWVAVHQDITQQRADERRIHRLARQDSLTALDNRRGLLEALDQHCRDLTSSHGLPFAVHAIDLDKFKDVNDTHGHATGDGLLEAVAARLRQSARQDDVVARLGGDEFAVIQFGLTDASQAARLAERLVRQLSTPYFVDGHALCVGASIGVAIAPDHGNDPHSLLKHADMALYSAKTRGRRTHYVFDQGLVERHAARKAFEADLTSAIANGELSMVYQPIISLTDFSLRGCEALMRWRHPVRGFVSPADFIPVAEELGLIHNLGQFALETAARDALAWPSSTSVCVNLSPAQFANPELASLIEGCLKVSGLSGDRLELEVTETVLLEDGAATLAVLHKLHDLGISIALDDFGTGYSSLRYLRSFPFNTLKIDRSFIQDSPSHRGSAAIVGAVAGLAHSLQMATVAEGIETEEHLALAKAAGCTAAQGYLFSRPVPASELPAVFAACARRALSAQMPTSAANHAAKPAVG